MLIPSKNLLSIKKFDDNISSEETMSSGIIISVKQSDGTLKARVLAFDPELEEDDKFHINVNDTVVFPQTARVYHFNHAGETYDLIDVKDIIAYGD